MSMYENSAVSGGNSINQSCPRILKTSEEGEIRDYEKSPNLDALSEQEPGKLWLNGLQVFQAQARGSWWGAAGADKGDAKVGCFPSSV